MRTFITQVLIPAIVMGGLFMAGAILGVHETRDAQRYTITLHDSHGNNWDVPHGLDADVSMVQFFDITEVANRAASYHPELRVDAIIVRADKRTVEILCTPWRDVRELDRLRERSR